MSDKLEGRVIEMSKQLIHKLICCDETDTK